MTPFPRPFNKHREERQSLIRESANLFHGHKSTYVEKNVQQNISVCDKGPVRDRQRFPRQLTSNPEPPFHAVQHDAQYRVARQKNTLFAARPQKCEYPPPPLPPPPGPTRKQQ